MRRRSLPQSEWAIRTCRDKVALRRVVPAEFKDGILVTFKLVIFLSCHSVKYLDRWVFTCDVKVGSDRSNTAQFAEVIPESNWCTSFTMRTSQTFVIPSLSDETTKSPYVRYEFLELTYFPVPLSAIDWVVVAVERLNTYVCADVPKSDCFITRATDEGLSVRSELDAVHAVYVSAERKSWLFRIHVPQLHSVVHAAWQQKVSSVVIRNFPDRLTVFSVSLGAASIDEIPNFDCAVTWSCRK